MPELPEVETVKRTLTPWVSGRVIEKAEVFFGGIIKKPQPAEFVELIKGKKIVGLERRGKYLLFRLSEGYTLVVHLRMTGQLIYCAKDTPEIKHTHLVFSFRDNNDELRFVDIRKFGLIYLLKEGEWETVGGLASLGPEPLDDNFGLGEFTKRLGKRKGRLKAFLLDQSCLAGIGNIYADEILFHAGLHPERPLSSLNEGEIQQLYHSIRLKLQEGIASRGASIRDYVDGRGRRGSFQERLRVYDRAGEICSRCGAVLIKKTVAGRGTVFCPVCQV